MRKTITIPASGKEQRYNFQGNSVIIESANTYTSIDEVPTFAPDSGTLKYPIYPVSTYLAQNGYFNSLVITGTDESAGDSVTIWTVEECLKTDINILFNETRRLTIGTTFTKSASNSVQSLSELDLVDADGNLPVKLYVTVSPLVTTPERGIKYAFNTNPAQGVETIGSYLGAGSIEILELDSLDTMLAFRFIAETSGETPLVNFTPEY